MLQSVDVLLRNICIGRSLVSWSNELDFKDILMEFFLFLKFLQEDPGLTPRVCEVSSSL